MRQGMTFEYNMQRSNTAPRKRGGDHKKKGVKVMEMSF